MTAEDWKTLMQKKELTLVATEKKTELVELQPDAPLIVPSSPPPAVVPPPEPTEEDNPFTLDDGETAITAAQDLHSTDKEKIKTLGNVGNPKAFAFGHMFTKWEQLEGASELAELDEVFLQDLEKFQIGRAGKDNRAKLYAEVLKADMQREFEMQLTAGNTAKKGLGIK